MVNPNKVFRTNSREERKILQEISDEQLVREFKKGNLEAFDHFVQKHQDRVYRLTCLWLRNGDQAEDATQEVFLRAFKGLRGFRFGASPFTWLYRTAKHVCSEYNRKQVFEDLDESTQVSGNRPDLKLNQKQIAEEIRNRVDSLPRRQKEVVVLRYFEEFSTAETAKIMGCREGTVKALLHKALQKLKQVEGSI